MLQHLKNDVALWRPDTWGCHHLWLRPPVVAMDPWIALIFVLQVLLGGKCPNSPGKIQSHCFMFTKKNKKKHPFCKQNARSGACKMWPAIQDSIAWGPTAAPLQSSSEIHAMNLQLNFPAMPRPFFCKMSFWSSQHALPHSLNLPNQVIRAISFSTSIANDVKHNYCATDSQPNQSAQSIIASMPSCPPQIMASAHHQVVAPTRPQGIPKFPESRALHADQPQVQSVHRC